MWNMDMLVEIIGYFVGIHKERSNIKWKEEREALKIISKKLTEFNSLPTNFAPNSYMGNNEKQELKDLFESFLINIDEIINVLEEQLLHIKSNDLDKKLKQIMTKMNDYKGLQYQMSLLGNERASKEGVVQSLLESVKYIKEQIPIIKKIIEAEYKGG